MIDLDHAARTRTGSRFDQVVGLLIGCVALLAAVLALVQVVAAGDGTRAQMHTARLISQVATRHASSTELLRLQLEAAERAAHLGAVGGNRAITGVATGDEAEVAIGKAELAAADKVNQLAVNLGQVSADDGPLDAYSRSLLASTAAETDLLAARQFEEARLAQVAGARSGTAVVGLSLVALAGVLAGLAGILGEARVGRFTLLAGWVAWSLALGAAVLALL
jgi:hypothetical protein